MSSRSAVKSRSKAHRNGVPKSLVLDQESGTFVSFALMVLRDLLTLRIENGSKEQNDQLRQASHHYVIEHQDPAFASLLDGMVKSLPWKYHTMVPIGVLCLGVDGFNHYVRAQAGELDAQESEKELKARIGRLEQDLRMSHAHLAHLQAQRPNKPAKADA